MALHPGESQIRSIPLTPSWLVGRLAPFKKPGWRASLLKAWSPLSARAIKTQEA